MAYLPVKNTSVHHRWSFLSNNQAQSSASQSLLSCHPRTDCTVLPLPRFLSSWSYKHTTPSCFHLSPSKPLIQGYQDYLGWSSSCQVSIQLQQGLGKWQKMNWYAPLLRAQILLLSKEVKSKCLGTGTVSLLRLSLKRRTHTGKDANHQMWHHLIGGVYCEPLSRSMPLIEVSQEMKLHLPGNCPFNCTSFSLRDLLVSHWKIGSGKEVHLEISQGVKIADGSKEHLVPCPSHKFFKFDNFNLN